MSTTAEIQAYVRANTATAYSYEGDLHALCDLAGVPAGHLLERLGALLETLPQGVLALLQNGSVEELLPILALFSPASLFAIGEEGVWYDPSDLSTLYQDAAGTTPVTAMEQPVGLMLDKSGRGNHCTFKAGTGRPVLSARVNMLTYSEDFSNAAWVKTESSITANAIAAPDGTTTADKLKDNATGAGHLAYQDITLTAGASYTFSCYAKKGEHRYLALRFLTSTAWTTNYICVFDLETGVATNSLTYPASSFSMTDVGNGWYRCSITQAANASGSGRNGIYIGKDVAGAVITSFVGDGTSGIYIWGADLRPTNDGIGLPAYQRVVDSATYDTAGFPAYLRADGTDDGGSTNSIDFTGTDKVTVFAGVRKLSDAAAGLLCELSSNINSITGAFYVAAPEGTGASGDYRYVCKGTIGNLAAKKTALAPTTSVLTGTSDIAADEVNIRINGVLGTPSAADLGTGNFGNYPLYLFARNNSNSYFNGRLYGLIVLGRAVTATEIANTERWINQKGRIY